MMKLLRRLVSSRRLITTASKAANTLNQLKLEATHQQHLSKALNKNRTTNRISVKLKIKSRMVHLVVGMTLRLSYLDKLIPSILKFCQKIVKLLK